MKRIVVCCDGTWNSPDKTDAGVPLATNVVKLAEALPSEANGMEQRVYYDAGVGTAGSRARRWFDGATGSGLSENIRQAYRFLVGSYRRGDELYFFGFSRGAFTVRSLCGLIRNSGLLRRDAIDRVDDAFALYRSRVATAHPRAREAVMFRRTWAVEDITAPHFVGVWDTVGALGNPLRLNGWLARRQRFHDTDLSSTVRCAYQALAIDEQRRHFPATLWYQPKPVQSQVLEQVWFAGVHSNIGGGYPFTGLSDLALDWMIERARNAGLEIDALETGPDLLERPQRSRKGPYRLLPPHHRPIGEPAPDPAGRGATYQTHQQVHASAREKYAQQPDYRPPALVRYLTRQTGVVMPTPHRTTD